MSKKPEIIVSRHETGHGTVRSYMIGFILSVVLTVQAYAITENHVLGGWALAFTLAVLAIIQLLVQLIFFLHLNRESRPRWNLQVLVFAVGVVVIIVFGSLWIMNNLAYNHAHTQSPASTNQFIIKDEGYKP